VDDILQSTSTDVEQVTIEPNGTWHSNKSDSQGGQDGKASPSADDDFIEIADLFTPTPNFKREETTDSANLLATPVTQSRFKPVSSLPKSSQKRPPPQVVDLTGSDDEEPPRPAKRQAFEDLLSSRRGSQNSFVNGYATEDLRSSTGQESLSLSPGQSNIYIDL
jgi:E3 SUMO-protein ligase PIAS1